MVRVAPGLGPVHDPVTPKPRMRVGRPSWYVHDTYQHGDFALKGALKLGSSYYAYPKGSETVFYEHEGVRTAIVRLADGTLHWIIEPGEVTNLPADLAAELERRFNAAT